MPRIQKESDKRRSAAERVRTLYNEISKLYGAYPELYMADEVSRCLCHAEEWLRSAAEAAERWAKEKRK